MQIFDDIQIVLIIFIEYIWKYTVDTTINIQFLNIYPYLILKLSDLYIKTDHLFEPEI